jgi:hypothetical protein
MLTKHRQVRNVRQPPLLSIPQVLGWSDSTTSGVASSLVTIVRVRVPQNVNLPLLECGPVRPLRMEAVLEIPSSDTEDA